MSKKKNKGKMYEATHPKAKGSSMSKGIHYRATVNGVEYANMFSHPEGLGLENVWLRWLRAVAGEPDAGSFEVSVVEGDQ